jgi:acid phosphatase
MVFFTFLAPYLLGAHMVLVDGALTYPDATVHPAPSVIAAGIQTAQALSPVSNVKGAAFDRFIQVWLENTNYDSSAGDANQKCVLT